MIREHIGLLTLAQHEDGAPQALALYDQKEGTPRCEQTAAAALLAKLPPLDGKTVTADALHCQKPTARTVAEKGGEYLLQIKGNRPVHPGRSAGRAGGSPFFGETSLGHGRVEQRDLHAFALEPDAAGFPYARSLIVVRSARTMKPTGHTSVEHRYYLSSLEPAERTPAQWQALIRGHWAGVEIRNHWRRDAVWGEDRSRTRHPNALATVALLALRPEHYPDHSLPEIKELCHSRPAACLHLIRSP